LSLGLLLYHLFRRNAVPRSVLEAIKQGDWNFEPTAEGLVTPASVPKATNAMPGTDEKLGVLAERLQRGLPLWHPADRRSYNDADKE
jgi:hypothetical protein